MRTSIAAALGLAFLGPALLCAADTVQTGATISGRITNMSLTGMNPAAPREIGLGVVPADWAKEQLEQKGGKSKKKRKGTVMMFPFHQRIPFTSDGQFRFDHVPSGYYILEVRITRGSMTGPEPVFADGARAILVVKDPSDVIELSLAVRAHDVVVTEMSTGVALAPPVAAVSPQMEPTDVEGAALPEPAATLSAGAGDRAQFSTRFEALPAEYQEQARGIGYGPGQLVQLEQVDEGLRVLPPAIEPAESARPLPAADAKERLSRLVAEEIAPGVATFDARATLAMDGTGHFTVSLPFDRLADRLQREARAAGLGEGADVAIRVDAVTWSYGIEPKIAFSFRGYLQAVIPPTETGGTPGYRAAARLEDLPDPLRREATRQGYEEGEAVRLQMSPGSRAFEVLPRPFMVGIRESYDALDKKKQKEARKQGYGPGDTVWSEFSGSGPNLVPAGRATAGPQMEVAGIELDPQTMKPVLWCVARFEELSSSAQETARSFSYREGDEVWVRFAAGRAEVRPASEGEPADTRKK